MTGVAAEQDVDRAFSLIDDGLALLSQVEWYRLPDEKVLEVLRRVEAHRRRLPVVDHVLVAEVEHRRLAERHCVRSTATLLRDVLRLSPREATGRVQAAERLGCGSRSPATSCHRCIRSWLRRRRPESCPRSMPG